MLHCCRICSDHAKQHLPDPSSVACHPNHFRVDLFRGYRRLCCRRQNCRHHLMAGSRLAENQGEISKARARRHRRSRPQQEQGKVVSIFLCPPTALGPPSPTYLSPIQTPFPERLQRLSLCRASASRPTMSSDLTAPRLTSHCHHHGI